MLLSKIPANFSKSIISSKLTKQGEKLSYLDTSELTALVLTLSFQNTAVSKIK